MNKTSVTSTLIHGCDHISKSLRYFLSPMGLIYKFTSTQPARPRPLALTVILVIVLGPSLSLMADLLIRSDVKSMTDDSHEYQLLAKSTFINRLLKFFRIYRITFYVAVSLIVIFQHSIIANVIASKHNIVDEKTQKLLARRSFITFLIKIISNWTSYALILSFMYSISENKPLYSTLLSLTITFYANTAVTAPIMYTCYLGAALGKHVENFSKLYVDSMFDQFMKAIEEPNKGLQQSRSSRSTESEQLNENNQSKFCHIFFILSPCWNFITSIFSGTFGAIKNLASLLNAHKYPELPEMKMTKLSTTTMNITISESKRVANMHLIRIRLRRTQIMLGELRDMISDINKMSSPTIMLHMFFETILLIFTATTSIQARIYKSINFLILPTVTNTFGLVVSAAYICTCLDDATSQLKLMINKLFDFIILNQRIQSNRKVEQRHSNDRLVSLADKTRDEEILNETWSQFQYTRKLANTIQFTMGGIVPVSRRLFLSILGHVLSAVFISIEIMSIIDTSQTSYSHQGDNTNSVSRTSVALHGINHTKYGLNRPQTNFKSLVDLVSI